MPKKKIAISLSNDILDEVDSRVNGKSIRSRSQYMEMLLRKGLESETAQKAVIMLKKGHHKTSLSSFKGKSLLLRQLEFLRKYGISSVFLITQKGPLLKDIEAMVKDSESYVKIIVTNKVNNADALKEMKNEADSNFVVLSGDIYNEFDLRKMMEKHAQKGALATMGLMSRDMPSKYGCVVLDDDVIIEFQEKPRSSVSNIVNAGIYIFNPAIFDVMKDCRHLEKHLFPKLAKTGQFIGYFTMGEYFHAKEV
jgi:mannose-1-phosphate guanylyltransferase